METTQNENKQTGGGAGGIIFGIILLMCFIGAGVLAWRANFGELTGMRILYTCWASTAGPFYLIYYAIVRLLLGYEYTILSKIPK
jgi:hypothetical protein